MGLKDVDIGAVLRRLAEKLIEEAIEQGKFDNLPGAGKPQNLEPLPADEVRGRCGGRSASCATPISR